MPDEKDSRAVDESAASAPAAKDPPATGSKEHAKGASGQGADSALARLKDLEDARQEKPPQP